MLASTARVANHLPLDNREEAGGTKYRDPATGEEPSLSARKRDLTPYRPPATGIAGGAVEKPTAVGGPLPPGWRCRFSSFTALSFGTSFSQTGNSGGDSNRRNVNGIAIREWSGGRGNGDLMGFRSTRTPRRLLDSIARWWMT
jgi:hypothetical protein